jgi:predicted nucleic acid-binding protein
MKRAVVDASVAAKWVVAEEWSEQASLLLACDTLCAPAHWLAEAVNVLWAKAARNELTQAAASERARALVQAPIESVPLPGLIEQALMQSLAHQITVYDSLYLVLAVARSMPLVTADAKLIRKISRDPRMRAHLQWVGDLCE